MLDGHLRLCAPTPPIPAASPRSAWRRCSSASSRSSPASSTRGSRATSTTAALRPIPAAWLPTRPIDQFVGGLDAVQREVDDLARAGP
ncbi:MAG: hypothetical protein U0802_01880 [Candidatus Binatia bacterium]